jgi:hypothetical protein
MTDSALLSPFRQWLRRNSLEIQDYGISLLLIGPTLALLLGNYVGAVVDGFLVGLGLFGGLLVGVGWFAESFD